MFLLDDRVLEAEEEIEPGSVVCYAFLTVQIDMLCYDMKRGVAMKLDYVDAVANPLAARNITTLEGIACLDGKKRTSTSCVSFVR